MLAVRGQEHPGNERRLAGSSSAQNLSRVGRAEMAAPPEEVPDFDIELQDYLRGLDLLNKVDCVSPLALIYTQLCSKISHDNTAPSNLRA